jgi:Pumilio-family RNA binding repeat
MSSTRALPTRARTRRNLCAATCVLSSSSLTRLLTELALAQYILDTGVDDACALVLRQLQGRFAELSCQKFSSNVVEKALKLSTVGMEAWKDAIVQELIDCGDHAELLRDQYGNYVLQARACPMFVFCHCVLSGVCLFVCFQGECAVAASMRSCRVSGLATSCCV